MPDVVISSEELGKQYTIGHASQRERYSALRDVITRAAHTALRNAKDFLQGRAIIEGDELEQIWALRHVSFEVERGEVIGIIGRNGAGKSTLLKIFSRITEPSEGRVTIRGRVASLLEVGTGFHPELSGRENIYLNGAILGMSRLEIRRKFDEIVAFAEVEKFLDTPVKRYSSGMYVRLAFAVAAHLESEILVVDEVLAVGDPQFQNKCIGKMSEVALGGRTVLFVSHNMGAVNKFCKRGIVLDHGCLVFSGSIGSAITTFLGQTGKQTLVTLKPRPDKPSITRIEIDERGLAVGDLILHLEFESPFALNPPIPGIVITSPSGVPVFGSNARFHDEGFRPKRLKSGSCNLVVKNLPLTSGLYHLSVWLADWQTDHDQQLNVLAFDFRQGYSTPLRPSASVNGHLDWPATWQLDDQVSNESE